ncbi:MAG: thioredoxin family protein [Gemmatimonadales bacterium]
MIDFAVLWDKGMTFENFAAASEKQRGLWEGLHKIAVVPDWALAAVTPGTTRKLVVIAEDWCGDASSSIPVVARFVEAMPGFELRLIRRDEHPEVMDQYLTNGSRSIPIVIALDEQFREIGHWGPRPAVLQEWVMANRPTVPKAELYPKVRSWYARDRGATTLREVLAAAGVSVTAPAQNIQLLPTE